jgi:HAD superfamily hydrolase (TIGR01509 family)
MGRIVDICFDVMEKKKTNNSPCSSAYGISNIADRIPTFKAVLFDMDGILYNSMPNHAVAWVRAMKDFGMHFTPEDSYATEGARGVDTIRVFAKKQLGKDLTEEEAQKIYDVKTRYFHELPVAPIFDGVVDLMRKIKSAGLQICIVTGSGQRPLFKRLVDDFGEFIDEEHIVTAYDVKRGKPNPDPYLMGLKKCGGIKPAEGVVVENAPLGVRAGVAAGCCTLAVNSGPLPDEVLLVEHPDALFSSIRELNDSL